MPAMRPIFLLAGLILGGCSLGAGGADPATPPRLEAANPPDISRLSSKIQDVFRSAKLSGYPRISPAHEAPVTALADWVVCLRSDAENDPRTYALLISGSEVVDYRLALTIDQCANQRFGPLPATLPVK
jgi:hypothetical protein